MKQISNTHFGVFELEKCTWRQFFFYIRPKKNSCGLSARSAGTTFTNLHQQKFPGEFRISGGIPPSGYVWKKLCSAGPHYPFHPRTVCPTD